MMIGLALAMMAAAATDSAGWKTYHNSRFGFSVCYPSAFLRAGSESGSGDGKVFQAKDGGEARVYGEFYYDDNKTLNSRMHSIDNDLRSEHAVVSYSVDRAGWSVRSGFIGKSIFYHKVFALGDKMLDLELTYPKANAASWKPIVAKMSRCFP